MVAFDLFEDIMREEAGFRFTDLPSPHKERIFAELLKQAFTLEPAMSESQLEADLRFPKHFREHVWGALDHLYTTSPEGLYTGDDLGKFVHMHTAHTW